MRLHCDDRRNEVQGIPALAGACGAPCYGYGQSSPCMHRVWIGVDSGVPVRKLARYHMVFCAKSSLTCSRAKFSSRVHLCLEASRMFRTTPHTKIWSNFVLSYFVRTLAYGTWLRSLINAPCLAWSRFGRSGQKTNTALISCSRTLLGSWHTGLGSGVT